jgi:hypothetical protein
VFFNPHGKLSDKSLHLSHQMVFSEGKGLTMVDEFNGKNFNLYKFKLDLVLVTNNFWEIVDGLQAPTLSTVNNMNMYEQ